MSAAYHIKGNSGKHTSTHTIYGYKKDPEDKDRAQQFLAIAKRYTDFSQLTTPMINEFVDKILVHAPEKIDGERTMEIEIYLKFIGKFDFPCRSLPRRNWPLKKRHERSASKNWKLNGGHRQRRIPMRRKNKQHNLYRWAVCRKCRPPFFYTQF